MVPAALIGVEVDSHARELRLEFIAKEDHHEGDGTQKDTKYCGT
jgi:hypothetical protein